MKVAFASTFTPTRCGIATYTEKLAEQVAAQGVDVVILAEHGAREGNHGSVICLPCFKRDEDYAQTILAGARQAGVELVHFQYATDIFGVDSRLPALIDELGRFGIKSVVTLHTVYDLLSGLLERKPGAVSFHRKLGRSAAMLVVHQEATMRGRLLKQGIASDKVAVIPHGTAEAPVMDRAESRRLLGIPADSPMALAFGFIHVQKNLHIPLMAFPSVVSQHPDARLVIAGTVQNQTWYNLGYVRFLKALSSLPSVRGKAQLRVEFIPEEEIYRYLAATDVVLFPYAQGYGSASGALHMAIGANRIPLCSDIPKFEEVSAISSNLLLPTHNPMAWARAMKNCFADSNFAQEVRASLANRSRETLWSNVALQHVRLYRLVMG